MEITSFTVATLRPPKDDLFSKIKASSLTLQEGDVIALSSKVVAIHQGRCVPYDRTHKDELIQQEADLYLERSQTPGGWVMHTVKGGILIASSGIDPFANHYVLWPENPKRTTEDLLAWFKREYKLEKLYLVLTDSHSTPMRRGVVGIAIAWAGFDPLYDNRVTVDLLGHPSGGSQTNLPDAIAAAAVLVMGEQNEGTPLVRLRNVPYIGTPYAAHKAAAQSYEVPMNEDIFAPFLKQNWKKGNASARA